MKHYHPKSGDSHETACAEAIALAKRRRQNVSFNYNGLQLVASPNGEITQPNREIVDLMRISFDVRNEGGDAERRLRNKCQHEHMTRTAVIAEWGDPRKWQTATKEGKCEGCDNVATAFDPEGIPLCDKCAEECVTQ